MFINSFTPFFERTVVFYDLEQIPLKHLTVYFNLSFSLSLSLSLSLSPSERHWRTLKSQRTSAGLRLTVWPASEPCSCVFLHATPTSLWTVSRTSQTGAWEWPSHYDCSCMERYKPSARIVYDWMPSVALWAFFFCTFVTVPWSIDMMNYEGYYQAFFFLICIWNILYTVIFLSFRRLAAS